MKRALSLFLAICLALSLPVQVSATEDTKEYELIPYEGMEFSVALMDNISFMPTTMYYKELNDRIYSNCKLNNGKYALVDLATGNIVANETTSDGITYIPTDVAVFDNELHFLAHANAPDYTSYINDSTTGDAVIDKDGKVVTVFEEENVYQLFVLSKDVIIVYDNDPEKDRLKNIRTNQTVSITGNASVYNAQTFAKYGTYIKKSDNKYYYVSPEGNVSNVGITVDGGIINIPLGENLWSVKKGSVGAYTYGAINTNGEIVIPFEYSEIVPVADDTYFVWNSSGSKYINSKNQEVPEPETDNTKRSYYANGDEIRDNHTGELLIDATAENMSCYIVGDEDDLLIAEKDGEWYQIVFTETPPVEEETPLAREFDGKFKYSSQFTKESEEYGFHYDESWFFNDSYTYQHDLTKMSIRMAMAGAQKTATNIKALYDTLGLSYTSNSVNYPTPETDSIGYAIGSRNIKDENGKEITLIAVTVRGGGYESEWGGNFRVGTDADHKGFDIAAWSVCDAIERYIGLNRNTMKEDIKVWISGFSRAAATSNLVAKKLDDGQIDAISADDVFAFCFECPQNTRNESNSKYNNIINIVNPIDLVTKVAMTDWGYSRYGTTYYLPCIETTSSYLPLFTSMGTEYIKILENCGYTQEEMENGILKQALLTYKNQASTLDSFMDNLSDAFKNPSNYVAKHQTNMMALAASTLGKSDAENANFLNQIGVAAGLFVSHPINSGNALEILLGTKFNSHFPELCLAWLDSLNGFVEQDEDYVYRKIFINCPVDISVYDESSQLVGKITNNQVQEIENGISAYLDDQGQKTLILPTDGEYDIQLAATADGNMTYTVTEFNAETGSTEKVVGYYQVEIANGDLLTGRIENLDDVETAAYALAKENENNITPSIIQVGEEVQTFEVTVTALGNGTAYGSGTYLNGEFVKFTAVPDEKAEFLGWYINDELISSELEYRMLVENSIEAEARFTEVKKQNSGGGGGSVSRYTIKFETNGGSAIKAITVNKNAVAAEPTAPTKESFKFEGWYTDKELTTAYNFTAKVTKNFTLYAKWTEIEKEPEVVEPETSTAFTDVKENDWFYANVQYVVENNLMNGVDNDKFAPNDTLTRAMLVTVLYRNAGEPDTNRSILFADVDMGAYYANAVSWAKQNGIVNGVTENEFAPDANITREQIAAIIHRYAQYKGMDVVTLEENLHFTDADEISEYAISAMNWAVGAGLMKGKSATTINPKDSATRAEIAAVLQRFIENIK